jgi:NAD-dependent dihydropyrimidine dehydrogenase PreA subunit
MLAGARAMEHADRGPGHVAAPPGDCGETGRTVPSIDRSRCEGKEDCVRVCPYGVFEIRRVEAGDRARFGPLARLKLWVHGGRQAYVTAPGDCHACGLCVEACPEKAISLRAPRA